MRRCSLGMQLWRFKGIFLSRHILWDDVTILRLMIMMLRGQAKAPRRFFDFIFLYKKDKAG